MPNEDIVIVLDIGKGMSTVRTNEGILLLEPARKAVSILISQKILFSKGDRISLVLFGGNTCNNLADASPEEYSNIETVCELKEPDLELCKFIEILKPGGKDADVIDALIVAMDIVVNDCLKDAKRSKNQKRLFLVTDVSAPMNLDSIDLIISQLVKRSVKLNVIGINFEDPTAMEMQDEDNKAFVRFPKKRENEKTIRKIAQKVGGVVVPVAQAIEIMSELRGKTQTSQRVSFRCGLDIGPDITIAVVGFTKTIEAKFPSMKRVSAVSLAQDLPGSKGVRTEKLMRPIDNPDEIVPPEQRVRGYKYGKTLVPFSKTDETKLNYQTYQTLTILGFTSSKNVPRAYFMGTTDCIVVDPLQASQYGTAFSALVRSCIELDNVAIVRFSKTSRTQPSLGTLSPALKSSEGSTYECFYFNKLPFVEDMRFHHFAPLIGENGKYRPNSEQDQAVEDIVRSLDLTNFYVDEEGHPVEAIKPKFTFNPSLQRFYQCLQERALHPEKPLPPIDPLVSNYLNPDDDLFRSAAPALKNLAASFPLQKTEKQSNQEKKTYWRDNLANVQINLNSYIPDLNKKRKVEGEFEFSLDQILQSGTTTISSTNPISDYQDMLSRRDVDLVDQANGQMKNRIIELILDSVGSIFVEKAALCLKYLREGCLREEEVTFWNNAIREVKALCLSKGRENFWNKFVDMNLTLIHSGECEESEYSPQQAKDFLREELKLDLESLGPSKPERDEEIDDILAEVE